MNIQLVIECYANSRSESRRLIDLLNVVPTAGMMLLWEVFSYKVNIHRGDQFGGSHFWLIVFGSNWIWPSFRHCNTSSSLFSYPSSARTTSHFSK